MSHTHLCLGDVHDSLVPENDERVQLLQQKAPSFQASPPRGAFTGSMFSAPDPVEL